jgi:type IV pilus assembly protein PilV
VKNTSQRGSSLLEPLIAIVILAFGLLGLAKFQLGTLAQTTDSQARLTASTAAEDLLTQVRVDLANVPCYQVPPAGACTSPNASDSTAAWTTQVQQSLPGFTTATASLSGNQFTVRLNWTSKAAADTRTYVVTTDVRP